ncbi:uncharacterized protein F4822DRAFT_432544 [Hypoxylon trugodes]|uniref:uncharacterized protein n=1 Tax=Hypoxylon trugodes TaxID=326681 RepID=UPI00219D4DC0|nr:uncharacterized protein F4822DRAFT_432544 [Hypoxylon trugodes]KAI1385690.1 hypothetical protein F4822DRAFT_432544 [Hypoxylon trugodes]
MRITKSEHSPAVVSATSPDIYSPESTVPVEGPAGTVFISDGRLWHATGPYSDLASENPVIIFFLIRSFVRQEDNIFLQPRSEIKAKMSDRVKRMLGFCANGLLGGVGGIIADGTYVKRVENPVGSIRKSAVV